MKLYPPQKKLIRWQFIEYNLMNGHFSACGIRRCNRTLGLTYTRGVFYRCATTAALRCGLRLSWSILLAAGFQPGTSEWKPRILAIVLHLRVHRFCQSQSKEFFITYRSMQSRCWWNDGSLILQFFKFSNPAKSWWESCAVLRNFNWIFT